MTTQNPVYASQAKPWLKYYDQKFIDQTLPALSAFEYVCQRSKNHLNDTALEYYGRKFTYADLIVNVKKTAAALRGAGVKKGDIITVVSVMTPEIIALFYAADMMGATLNLVDPRYSVEGIREYIEEVDSHLLVCLNVVYERCRQAAKRTNVEKVIALSPADSLPPVMAVGYKLTTPDKNKYASNVIRWKQFIKGGEGIIDITSEFDCFVDHSYSTDIDNMIVSGGKTYRANFNSPLSNGKNILETFTLPSGSEVRYWDATYDGEMCNFYFKDGSAYKLSGQSPVTSYIPASPYLCTGSTRQCLCQGI